MPHKLFRYRTIFFVVLFLGWHQQAFLQPLVQVTTNKSTVLIGEPIQVTIQAKFTGYVAPDKIVVWPDSLAHFEIAATDTCKRIFSNGQLAGFKQEFTLISFDSGYWHIPAVGIRLISETNNQSVLLYEMLTTPIN